MYKYQVFQCSHDSISEDILLFLVSKGEERAAEDQQRIISALENAKLCISLFETNYITCMSEMK